VTLASGPVEPASDQLHAEGDRQSDQEHRAPQHPRLLDSHPQQRVGQVSAEVIRSMIASPDGSSLTPATVNAMP